MSEPSMSPSVMRVGRQKGLIVASIASLTLIACDSGTAPRAPTIRSVRIEPTNFQVQVGGWVQLRAIVDAEPGADTTVRWASDASESGSVSPTGFVTTCYPSGSIVVHAMSVGDPSKSATLTVPVLVPSIAWALVGGVVGASDGRTIPDNAVAGDVEVMIWVSPTEVLACRRVLRVDVRLQGNGIDSLIGRLDFSPPFSDNHLLRVPLRASTFPNGVYQIGGTVVVSGVTQPASLNGRAITISHP